MRHGQPNSDNAAHIEAQAFDVCAALIFAASIAEPAVADADLASGSNCAERAGREQVALRSSCAGSGGSINQPHAKKLYSRHFQPRHGEGGRRGLAAERVRCTRAAAAPRPSRSKKAPGIGLSLGICAPRTQGSPTFRSRGSP